ncbi:TRAP transporter large permease [Acuticoccus mangrovi]|uniref:TRAP transporter large permease protein n=1 Tax=Acuticoccus mangrovi TaxID=2796142 RepID=A0A934MEJ2_9HYPH|nr:TRAP transporter large permease subunit [Acuticoccus mangrovi]MBJ3774433.1 TRAP transporter large permease subunit [Acuticoccus mangrovi]
MSTETLEIVFVSVLFGSAILALLSGFPVAFALGGAAILTAFAASFTGLFDMVLLGSFPSRILDIVLNQTLVAVPLFVFMGTVLERSRIAEELLLTMGQLFGSLRGGLGIAVVIVGALLAASTGIVGATIVTMALISLPAMQRAQYNTALSCGVICASGTLAQLIPPSTVLILLGTTLQNANTQAQLQLGNFFYDPMTVTDLFAGALIPGFVLVAFYVIAILVTAFISPKSCPPVDQPADDDRKLITKILRAMLPPLALILVVLGSILSGLATATESAALGGVGAMILAFLKGGFGLRKLGEASRSAMSISLMIYAILVGATVFSLVFRGLGGEELVTTLLSTIPGDAFGATLFVLGLIFLLGFMIDTFEIIFIVIPIFAPALIVQGVDPLWFGVAVAMVLQTSYLTPPFGFGIFYLQGGAKGTLALNDIYKGVTPFVLIQLAGVGILWIFPGLVSWLPTALGL